MRPTKRGPRWPPGGAARRGGGAPPNGAVAVGTAAAGTPVRAAGAATGDAGPDASIPEDAAHDAGAGTVGDTVMPAAVPPTISIPANETIVPLGTPTPTRTPTATPTRTPTAVPGGAATIGGCPVFPADNSWNQDISTMPVDANSATYISNIGGGNLHADFGGGGAVRHPVHRRAAVAADDGDQLHGLRRRERSGTVSDSAERADRGRRRIERRPARAGGAAGHVQAVRAVQRVSDGERLGRRVGRGLRPAVECAAARDVDIGRRRGAADHGGARAVRRGGGGADQPRGALHREHGAEGVGASRHALRHQHRARRASRTERSCG